MGTYWISRKGESEKKRGVWPSLPTMSGKMIKNTRWTIFNKAKVLEMMIFPPRIRFRILCVYIPKLSNFLDIHYRFYKINLFLKCFVIGKWIPKIIKASDNKSADFIPQAAILTPFKKSIFATSHFVKFGFKPEKDKNVLQVLTNSKIDCLFLKKGFVITVSWICNVMITDFKTVNELVFYEVD